MKQHFTTARRWSLRTTIFFAFAALSSLTPALAAAGPQVDDWSVASITRTVELGSVASLTDVHIVRAPFANDVASEPTSDDQVKPYYFALSSHEARHISGLEATARYGPGIVPKQRAVLRVAEAGPLDSKDSWADANATAARPHLYSVQLPLHFLRRGDGEDALADVTVTVTGMLVHASEALPKSIGQGDSQYLLWKGSASPVTPYGAASGRVKVKSPSPTVLSYTTEPPLSADQMVKSGSTITFGPYESLPALLTDATYKPNEARVHYLHNAPLLTLVEAKRTAKVSHWRNRLSVEDQLWLRNDGAALKGHFSRVQHQLSTLVQRVKTHTVTNIVMHLPPGIVAESTRFGDESGNVSSSNFRPAPPSPSHVRTPAHLLSATRASVLDVRPRYPLLGGWNYTCHVAWSVKMSDGWLKNVGNDKERFSVQIPFLTAVKDAAVDDAELRIVLPEGASDIVFQVPFSVEVERQRTWSFLDTIGKPVLLLRKRGCSERHGGMVTVEYTLTTSEKVRKALVAGLAGVLLAGSLRLLSKVDLSIKA